MSFLRAAATVSGLTMVSRVFGFVRDVMAAAIVGAGPVADAFFVALRLPNFFRSIAAEGAFSVSFVPLFSKTLKAEGQEVAQEFASQTMAVLLAVLIPFSLLAMIFMPQVLSVLAPGFQDGGGERYELAITLTRITFGYLLFMSLASLVGGMLNAIDKFFAFATAPILFNLMQIIFLAIASQFPTAGHAMAWGVMISGVLQLIWLLWVLHKSRVRLRLVLPKMTDKIRRLFQLMGPGVLGASAVQINLLVDTIIASTLPVGAVSYLYYAQRLDQLPIGLIGAAVGTALLPKLATKIAANEKHAANHLFNRAIEWTALLAIPATTALLVMPNQIISVLFERGEFTAQDAAATAQALFAYAIGLPSFIGIKVLSTALYAQENTKTPVKITLVCATLNIVLCLALVHPFGHMGIAIATSIAGWVQLIILTVILHRREGLDFDAQLKKNMLRILVAALAMAIFLNIMCVELHAYFAAGHLKAILALGVTIAMGGLVYLWPIFWFNVLNLKTLKQSFKGQDI